MSKYFGKNIVSVEKMEKVDKHSLNILIVRLIYLAILWGFWQVKFPTVVIHIAVTALLNRMCTGYFSN